jgi:hypothetical protein
MEKYKNLNGDSGVLAYENGSDYIRVKFKSNVKFVYLYTYESAGSEHIETMKSLAISGNGLNAYINRYTKKLYAKREQL